MYYRTLELNEKLYFHYKGFAKIENMQLFPELKCLYWEGNGCTEISGLDSNTNLVSLYLQENIIKRIEGLSTLSRLHTLQLSDNLIQKIEGLSFCTALDSLYIRNNRIGLGGLDDVVGLLECKNLTCLDIQGNRIDFPEMIDEVLVKLDKLKVLYLQNNEIAKGKIIPAYRKTTIAKIGTLTYLDDRPVFMEDRRHAEAYYRGGIDAERAERELMRKERDEEQQRQHKAFKNMMRQAREDKRAADEAKARAEADAKGEAYVAPKPAEEPKKFPNTDEDEP